MPPQSRTRRLSQAEQAAMRRRDDDELRRRDAQTEAVLDTLAQGGSGRPMPLNSVDAPTARVTTDSKFRLQDFGEDIGAGRRFNRETGKADSPYYKGWGFLGPLTNASGQTMTEWSRTGSLYPVLNSVGEIVKDGPWVDYPLIVPTLNKEQIQWILSVGYQPGETREDIEIVAADHARMRIREGLSPFASKGEEDLDAHRGLRKLFAPR
jgi:hypothetical protein